MKHKIAIMTSLGVAAGLMSACGNDHGQSSTAAPPPAGTSLPLTTQEVLAEAQNSSETAAPLVVNAGAVTITDTSDTSEPISINGL